jgi:La domain
MEPIPSVETVAGNESAESLEHPHGEEICRQAGYFANYKRHFANPGQVEYYFSDENLPNDQHLLTLCGGSQNLPVSLNQILGWKKMRKFKPKSKVIYSLKKSLLLEVIDTPGKLSIRRKVPFVPKTIDTDPTAICTLQSKDNGLDSSGKKAEAQLPLGYIVKENGLITQIIAVCFK